MNEIESNQDLIKRRKELLSLIYTMITHVPAEHLHTLALTRLQIILERYGSCRKTETPKTFEKVIEAKKRYIEGELKREGLH